MRPPAELCSHGLAVCEPSAQLLVGALMRVPSQAVTRVAALLAIRGLGVVALQRSETRSAMPAASGLGRGGGRVKIGSAIGTRITSLFRQEHVLCQVAQQRKKFEVGPTNVHDR